MPKAKRRSDFHYTAEDGSKWDSRFEYLVYRGAVDAGLVLRRCEKGSDTIPYTHTVPRASCQDCGSARVGSARGITPDLYFDTGHPTGEEGRGYVEIKGFMRAPKRALYRSLFKEKPNTPLCLVIQSNFKVGKGSFGGWITKYLGIPWGVWKGTWPPEWNMPDVQKPKSVESKKSRGSKKATKEG